MELPKERLRNKTEGSPSPEQTEEEVFATLLEEAEKSRGFHFAKIMKEMLSLRTIDHTTIACQLIGLGGKWVSHVEKHLNLFKNLDYTDVAVAFIEAGEWLTAMEKINMFKDLDYTKIAVSLIEAGGVVDFVNHISSFKDLDCTTIANKINEGGDAWANLWLGGSCADSVVHATENDYCAAVERMAEEGGYSVVSEMDRQDQETIWKEQMDIFDRAAQLFGYKNMVAYKNFSDDLALNKKIFGSVVGGLEEAMHLYAEQYEPIGLTPQTFYKLVLRSVRQSAPPSGRRLLLMKHYKYFTKQWFDAVSETLQAGFTKEEIVKYPHLISPLIFRTKETETK